MDMDKLVEADKDEKTSPIISKGNGLRKWKRMRRRVVVKDDDTDTSVNMENSRILKRVLSESANPQAKQMHFPEPDAKQDSLGSVGSVNNNNMAGFAIDGDSHGIGLAFSAGIDSDNSEDRSSTAASGPTKVRDKQRGKNLGGKSVISSGDSGKSGRVEKSKKAREERIKIEKENSHSSMESADSRSSNFVFMQGSAASFSLSSGRRMVDYNEENSDHDAHTSNRQEGGEAEEGYSQGDSVGESEIKNNGSPDNLDPFNSFHTLQEALQKELEKFQELGKEPISSSLQDGAESSSCIHAGEASSSSRFGSEKMGLTSPDSEILNLANNVEHMETKLEETKSMTHIRELKSKIHVSERHSNGGTEIGIEDMFLQKMEAEIEYIIFSRSVDGLSRKIKLVEEETTLAENEAHKTLSKLGEAEIKAEDLKNQAQDLQSHCVGITETQEVKDFKKRVFKTTSCLLLQLGVLVIILFNSQLISESANVVPT